MAHTIREARAADFDTIVRILATSFRNESYVNFLHPHPPDDEARFGRDLERYWRKQVRLKCWHKSHVLMVSEDAEGGVVGVAVWKEPEVVSAGVIARVKTYVLRKWAELVNALDQRLLPDSSLDPARRNAYVEAEPFFAHHFTSQSPHYTLDLLGVLPDAQGQGQGRALVAWGLARAKEQDAPATVVCSAGSSGFYAKCGFEIEIGNVTHGIGNPLSSVEGGEILFTKIRRKD